MVPGGPAVECSDLGWRDVFLVPLLKPSLGDRVFALDAFEQRRDLCEGVRPGEILAVGLISECAVMLDVLAGGLHGGHAKGGGGALKEVAQGRELGKIFGGAGREGTEIEMSGMHEIQGKQGD